MKYTLYIGENCHQCSRVLEFMTKSGCSFNTINVDLDGLNPPIPIFAYPALFENQQLLRYGSDIISYLKEKNLR